MEQDVSYTTFRVAWLLYILSDSLSPTRIEVLMYILATSLEKQWKESTTAQLSIILFSKCWMAP